METFHIAYIVYHCPTLAEYNSVSIIAISFIVRVTEKNKFTKVSLLGHKCELGSLQFLYQKDVSLLGKCSGFYTTGACRSFLGVGNGTLAYHPR